MRTQPGTLDLEDPRWGTLAEAYGSAEGVPQMIRDLDESHDDDLWEDIYSSLCHQGTVYTASYAAFPHVVAIAAQLPPADRVNHCAFLGAVAGSVDADPVPPFLRDAYVGAIDAAVPLTREALFTPGTDESSAVYLLSALAAFQGFIAAADLLDGFVDGEYEFDCPSCSGNVSIWVQPDGLYSAPEDVVANPNAPRRRVEPGNLREESEAYQLRALAEQARQPRIAELIEQLYGRARCLHCEARIELFKTLSDFRAIPKWEEWCRTTGRNTRSPE